MPMAPWALLFGWWSPQLETNSNRLLLRGEGCFGMKALLALALANSHSQLGRAPPRAYL